METEKGAAAETEGEDGLSRTEESSAIEHGNTTKNPTAGRAEPQDKQGKGEELKSKVARTIQVDTKGNDTVDPQARSKEEGGKPTTFQMR